MEKGTSAGRRIPELDGLRGLAIGLVLVCHYLQFEFPVRHGSLAAYLKALPALSWSGVDLFFVLSGFLIGGILLDARESANYFRVFYVRRFFRIVPIYAVMLALFPAALWFTRSAPARTFWWLLDRPAPWYSCLTFTQNFWMAHTGLHGANWLTPTWSLAVEEQFYLTLPLLIAVVPLRRLAWLLFLLICTSPLLRVGLMAMWPGNSMAEIVLMPCRADALLMGVLAAVAVRDQVWRVRIANGDSFFGVLFVVLTAGLVFLGRFAPGISFPWMRSVGFSWLALFYVSVMLFAVTRQSSLLSRCLRNRGLMWLGSIAYGVYLIHEPVQGFVFGYLKHAAPGIYGWRDLPLALLSLAVTLVVARVSWIYFERPLVQIGHRWQYQGREGARVEGGSASPVRVSP